MSMILAQKLDEARHRLFVGRAAPLNRFREELTTEARSFHVMHVSGPGGIGKTALLNEFEHLCGVHGRDAYYLDARGWESSPEAALSAIRAKGKGPDDAPALDWLADRTDPVVVMIDTFEHISQLDRWIRETLVPGLPANVLLVLSGRSERSDAWKSDNGLQSISTTVTLRNLEAEDSRTYLRRRGVPEDRFEEILAFSYGHPLALAVIADSFEVADGAGFDDETEGAAVPLLLERMVRASLQPAERRAVQAASLVRRLTRSLLQALLDDQDAHALYDWLRTRSYMESGSAGLTMHDLARDVVAKDLARTDPVLHETLHRRARDFYNERLQDTGADYLAVLTEYIFLHRLNPVVRSFFVQLQADYRDGRWYHSTFEEVDRTAVLAMVRQHEGQDSAELASAWLSSDASRTIVYRDQRGDAAGFLMTLSLDDVGEDDPDDPSVAAARRHLRDEAPMRAGERAILFRFWMARESYQDISPVQGLIFVQMVKHYLTEPSLAYSFLPCADADRWTPLLAYAGIRRLPQAGFDADGRTFGTFGHDWRAVPPNVWLDTLASREIGDLSGEDEARPECIFLNKEDFRTEVKNVLKHYHRPNELRESPLLSSRFVMANGAAPRADADERMSMLRTSIQTATEELTVTPKLQKYHRALVATYLEPETTQENAAEALGVPFSTYRRHLGRGIEAVTERLWRREVGA